jgi:hypothetical protein
MYIYIEIYITIYICGQYSLAGEARDTGQLVLCCLPGVNISMWLQKQAPEHFQGVARRNLRVAISSTAA